MFNNIVNFEKLYNFLLLYKRSFQDDFTQQDELMELSKEISKIGDAEYNAAPRIVKHIIDVVRMYEFDAILNHSHYDDNNFEKFWILRIIEKVSQIKYPTNDKQRELIRTAKYILKRTNYLNSKK